MNLEKHEQDLMILSHLQSHRRIRELSEKYGQFTKRGSSRIRRINEEEQRQDILYYFCGLPICRAMYCFLHNLGSKRYSNIRRHYDEHGIEPRHHGLLGRAPNRKGFLTNADKEAVVNFITAFAERTAIPLPGRMPNHKDFRVVKLPSNESKLSVYRRYVVASKDQSSRTVGVRSFTNLWNRHLPFITTMRPKTDLCEFCQFNVLKLQRVANNDDPEKTAVLNECMNHLNRAKVQREFYNSWREKAKKGNTTEIDGVVRTFSVLSFDFAENVHYPSSPQQVGPLYFKTARKCNIFGIHDERTGIQTNYLIDESDMVGKGANVVISLLDYHLRRNINSEILILFADNCVGQNKNNAMIQYLYYRLLTRKNIKIEYNFLLAGHTKFAPDRNFGLLKAKYALSNIDCLQDIVDTVFASSPNGFNVAVSTVNPLTYERVVPWSYWDTFLKAFFKKFPGMLKYHHFIFKDTDQMLTKPFANDDESRIELQVVSLESIEASVIEDIIPEGLSVQRQWYLYTQIRQFCSDPLKADLVAPRPVAALISGPHPSTEADNTNPDEPPTGKEVDGKKVLRRRGRPPKTSIVKEENVEKSIPRKKGRPRKTIN